VSTPEQSRPPEGEPYKDYSLGAGLMVLGGAALLIPGICTFISIPLMLEVALRDVSILMGLGFLWAACLLVSYGGLKLIQRGRAARSKGPNPGT
jgi:hypothetical protein